MPDRAEFERLDDEVERLRIVLAARPAGGAALRELASLQAEEIVHAARLHGSEMDPRDIHALVDTGRVPAGARFADCLDVVGYADAARWVATAVPIVRARPRPYLRLAEIVALHARLSLGRGTDAWRQTTGRRDAARRVAPPPWLIPREIEAYVDRFAAGAPAAMPAAVWVADAIERFLRILPFDDGNDRVARLIANLLHRRLNLPPLVITLRARAGYLTAVDCARNGDPWPLACLIVRSTLRGFTRMVAAQEPRDRLRPLADFAGAVGRGALYKAAQRERLRTIRRGADVLTTADWVAQYQMSRSRAGRPGSRGSA